MFNRYNEYILGIENLRVRESMNNQIHFNINDLYGILDATTIGPYSVIVNILHR